MTDTEKLSLIRSIVGQATLEAGNNLGPGETAAIAWRTIGQINKVISPPDDENRPSNLVTA